MSSVTRALFAGDFELHLLRGLFVEEQSSLSRGPLMRSRGGWRQPLLGQFDKRLPDVIDTQAEMVQPWTVLSEPGVERMFWRQRFDQLQVRSAEIEVRQTDGAVVNDFAEEYGQTHAISPDLERLVRVGHGDSNMIETAKGSVFHGGLNLDDFRCRGKTAVRRTIGGKLADDGTAFLCHTSSRPAGNVDRLK